MKRTITIITSILFAFSLSAQINTSQHLPKLKVKYDKVTLSGNEVLSHLMVNPNPYTYPVLNSNSKSTMTSEVIGWTTYDLQTNGSVQNRIVVHNDGTISAAWTMSSELNSTFSDRGTGYNHFDGSNWTFAAPSPHDQCERSVGSLESCSCCWILFWYMSSVSGASGTTNNCTRTGTSTVIITGPRFCPLFSSNFHTVSQFAPKKREKDLSKFSASVPAFAPAFDPAFFPLFG